MARGGNGGKRQQLTIDSFFHKLPPPKRSCGGIDDHDNGSYSNKRSNTENNTRRDGTNSTVFPESSTDSNRIRMAAEVVSRLIVPSIQWDTSRT